MYHQRTKDEPFLSNNCNVILFKTRHVFVNSFTSSNRGEHLYKTDFIYYSVEEKYF